jgi:hypothetical protein
MCMDWWLSVGLCGVVFEPCTLKNVWLFLTVYGICALLVGNDTSGETLGPALPLVSSFCFLP